MYKRKFFSLIAGFFAVGVCAYITYISKNANISSIAFNLSILGVMVLMILISYLTGLHRLSGICKGLYRGIQSMKAPHDAGSTEQAHRPVFENEFLNNCYREYRKMQGHGNEVSADISSFINEDVIEARVHRGILELIPDILTSLGILGTFVGLVMGLREFNPSGYEEMASSVAPLIDGIKVAFITSIYGISLSLAYSFHLRSEFSALSALVDEFLDLHYQKICPPYEIDSVNKLLGQQQNQEEMITKLTSIFVEQMSISFGKVITPAFDQMTNAVQAIVNTYLQSQEQVMTQVCDSVLQRMRGELRDEFAAVGSLAEELKKSQETYTDFLDASMIRIQQTLTAMQDSANRSSAALQKNVTMTSDALQNQIAASSSALQTVNRNAVNALEDSVVQLRQYTVASIQDLSAAQKNAAEVNKSQMDTYQDYIRFIYQSLNQYSEIWKTHQDTLQSYSNAIANMNPVQMTQQMQNAMTDMANDLHEMYIRQQAAAASYDSDEQQQLIYEVIEKLDEIARDVKTPALLRRRKTRTRHEERE